MNQNDKENLKVLKKIFKLVMNKILSVLIYFLTLILVVLVLCQTKIDVEKIKRFEIEKLIWGD